MVWMIGLGGCLPWEPVEVVAPEPPPNRMTTSEPPGTTSVPPTCGDGVVQEGEGCDEGAANADDGPCTSLCQPAQCGDGLIWAGVEGCDEGANNADDGGCTTTCEVATCGDTLVWKGVEECDDGNLDGGDGCSPACLEPRVFDLVDAHTKWVGETIGAGAGYAVDFTGDMNGDGLDDVVVSAPFGSGAGIVYIVVDPPAATVSLSDAHARIMGVAPIDRAGAGVAGAGDVDGDGAADLLVGAPQRSDGAYLLRGPISGTRSLLLARTYFEPSAEAAYTTASLYGRADVNGDGRADVLLGGIEVDPKGDRLDTAYLAVQPPPGTLSLPKATATFAGDTRFGQASQLGRKRVSAGDVDGDGLPDVVIGAPNDDEAGVGAGAAHLVWTPVLGAVSLDDADAKLLGEGPNDAAGTSVSAAGDINGDGYHDLVVGAPAHGQAAPFAGSAYVVYGPVEGTRSLTAADAELVGEGASDSAGGSVASGGDVNGDGRDDVFVSAHGHDGTGPQQGAGYLVHGAVYGVVPLALADIKLARAGTTADLVGWTVASDGDVDGDGLDDLLLGAHGDDEGGDGAGAAYLVLARDL